MTARQHVTVRAVLLSAIFIAAAAFSHSASNAYLTIKAEPGQPLLHAQWDIALRDLEFVLALNRNGDGKLTWGDLNSRKDAVTKYVYSRIGFASAGRACTIRPQSLQVDEHADGAYVALFFDLRCGDRPAPLTLNYSLFFDVDPSHRCILVLQNGDAVSTALLAPDTGPLKLALR